MSPSRVVDGDDQLIITSALPIPASKTPLAAWCSSRALLVARSSPGLVTINSATITADAAFTANG